MRTPLVVVTGVDPHAIDSAMLALSWDLPQAVAVRHRIDPASQVLTRVVSDMTGILEREEIPLEHACVQCAMREDILPTLERLARDGRWLSILSGLPSGAEGDHLAEVLTRDHRLARHLKLCSVVAAMDTERLTDDLLGDALLCERGWHLNPYDRRGVGEVGCAQVEFADLVLISPDPSDKATALTRLLARPDAGIVHGSSELDTSELLRGRHNFTSASQWASPTFGDQDLPQLDPGAAWRLELISARAFHPERLLDNIERLGSGFVRSRGCFWLPTRAGALLEWGGSGGQLSIGSDGHWGRRTPKTRLVLTGLDAIPEDVIHAFEETLLTTPETERTGAWTVMEDGLEPWLGAIRDVA